MDQYPMVSKYIWCTVAATLFSAPAGAFTDAECPRILKQYKLTKISRILTSDNKVCTLSVTPAENDHSFRSFGFGSDGQISVYAKTGGNRVRADGATKTFMIFPFGKVPSLAAVDKSGSDFLIKTGSHQYWQFSSKSSKPGAIYGQLASAESGQTECQFEVKNTFSDHDAGVNLGPCKHHLVLENDLHEGTDLVKGGEAQSYPDRTATLTDPAGHQCHLRYKDLYNYPSKSMKGKWSRDKKVCFDPTFKFHNNQELANSLSRKCPRLDLSMLQESGSKSEKKSPSVFDVLDHSAH